MWFPPEEGAELFDFELEPGGGDEWGYSDHNEELRRVILYLVREKNSMLVKLRGLCALRGILQSLCTEPNREHAIFFEGAGEICAEDSLVLNADAGLQLPTRKAHRSEKLHRDEKSVTFKHDNTNYVYGNTDSSTVSCFVLIDKCNPIPH